MRVQTNGPFMNRQQPSGKEETAETQIIDDPASAPEAFFNPHSFADGASGCHSVAEFQMIRQ
jgi:hypothetical protein